MLEKCDIVEDLNQSVSKDSEHEGPPGQDCTLHVEDALGSDVELQEIELIPIADE